MKVLKLLSAIVLVLLLTGCLSAARTEYYAQRENYISAAGVVTHISNDEENRSLYIAFEPLEPAFDDNNFKLAGENYDTVMERGLLDALQLGTAVEFTSAPRYFGDGYVMPIASIEIAGVTYLTFEEGFASLSKSIQ